MGGISYEWLQGSHVIDGLVEEVTPPTGMAADPDLVAELEADLVEPERPASLGVIVARRDGDLIGWAEVVDPEDGDRTAELQLTFAPRLAWRLAYGFFNNDPHTAEEEEVFLQVCRQAAERAKAAGLRTLSWHGADTGPEGKAAMVLGAVADPHDARLWKADLGGSGPREPEGDEVHEVAVELPGDGPAARLEAWVSERDATAYVNIGESFHHHHADAATLTGLVEDLIRTLRRQEPTLTQLIVFEFDDDAIRRALGPTDLTIAARLATYRLALRPRALPDVRTTGQLDVK